MNLNLQPTIQIVGNVDPPESLRGNHPDDVLIGEARQLLAYRTNLTLLEWWRMFPCQKWWRYAIRATKTWATKPNYRYFLKALMEAAKGTKKFEACWAKLKQLYSALDDTLLGRKADPPKLKPHGEGCTCEKCWEVIQENNARALPDVVKRRVAEPQPGG